MHLRGVHQVKKRLADGTVQTYRYAWRGGPRLASAPGTPEIVAEYAAAVTARRQRHTEDVAALVSEYRASSEYLTRRDRTRRDYGRYLRMIEEKFGDLPIAALADSRVRQDFKAWRDTMIATPRKADLLWAVLSRVMSVAKDNGRIAENPCLRGGKLYTADRSDAIWTEDMIATVRTHFPKHLRHVFILALETGQRQGDVLLLPWSAYDGNRIRMRQSKTRRRVSIPATAALKAEIATIPRHGPIMLTSTDKRPWTGDGFRASWGRACKAAGIEGVTFHDARGSAVTRLAEAGCTSAEIATITGHSLRDVEAILDAHYLSRTDALGDSAIAKLDRKEAGTKSVK
jgi:integrase